MLQKTNKAKFPSMVMSRHVLDEGHIRDLPPRQRLDRCTNILKNEIDESLRWDAVWLAGELAELTNPIDPMFDEVSDLMAWVLKNDTNGVVKHEACFQIAARNMRKKIPDLVDSAFYDKSSLVRHEALESLGLMRAFDSMDLILKSTKDQSNDVRETAEFVLKRLQRLKELGGEYKPSSII